MANFIDIGKDVSKAIEAANAGKQKIEATLLKGVEKALTVIEADAKRECPVDDGRLRSSITHTVESTNEQARGRVGTNVEYGPYVHEGTGIYARNGNGRKKGWAFKHPKTGEVIFTRGQKPKPFLRDAMDKNQDKIANIFKETVDSL